MHWLPALLILALATDHRADDRLPARLREDRTLAQCFAQMLGATRFGAGNEERGAFIVVSADGRRRCQHWSSRAQRRVEWRGVIPEGTIAVAHTHPATAPLPSDADRKTAMALHLPLIVIAPFRVTAVLPDGSQETLAGPGWMNGR
jgi:proteasome lid subunit RPN8/RPN11